MSDQQITCSDCGGGFAFTAAEQAFYAEKGLASPPKRCKACRAARKTTRGGAPSSRGGGAPRRFSNDVNEYRSPMTGGFGGGNNFNSRPRSGGGAPQRDRGDAPRGNGGFGGGAPRGNFGGGAPRGQGNANANARPSAPSWRGGGGAGDPRAGANEYRSPAFPDARPPRGHDKPPRDGQGNRSSGEKRAPREAAPRPEKPKFDITCGECGASAQVPFKPLEGRQVFCQDCYRARRGIAKDVRDAADAAGAKTPDANDTGIVE